MKKRIIKILFLSIIFLAFKIPGSNAYFTSNSEVKGIEVSTSCWANPNATILDLPADASYTNNPNVNFKWKDTTSSCPVADLTYKFEAFDNSGLTGSPIFYSDWVSGTSFSVSSMPDGVYYWHVKARDQFGNESTSAVWSVTVDTVKPESVITKPVNPGSDNTVYTVYWAGDIEGTASDTGSGIDHVDLSIHRLVLNVFWNGTAWLPGTESSVRVPATGTDSWHYTLPSPHIGIFLITSHAVDKAGNVENSYTITVVNDEPEVTELVAPEASATPEASPSPTVTPTPSPSPTVSPTETGAPTQESSSTPPPSTSEGSPAPTPYISPEATPTPTETPNSTETPTPTETETPSPTPEETVSPAPVPTEVPSPTDSP